MNSLSDLTALEIQQLPIQILWANGYRRLAYRKACPHNKLNENPIQPGLLLRLNPRLLR